MQKALLIAEKPSLMRTIEAVYRKHRKDIPYSLTFVSQRGHLYTLKLPSELDPAMKKWSLDHLPFHPEEHGGFQYKPITDKKVAGMPTVKDRIDEIKKELKSGGYDFVIHAGDPDQEGELLVRIVLAELKCKLPVKRFWTNDTTDGAVLQALQNLRDDDNDPFLVHLLDAAYGRQHSDYRFGMNLSEAASVKTNSRCAIGRVKTPILAIICRREDEIENFKPKTVYGIDAAYKEGFAGSLAGSDASEDNEKGGGTDGKTWFETEQEAKDLIASLPKSGTVTRYEKKRETTYAPKLYKLSTLQVDAGKKGINDKSTLDAVQKLYEAGFLSYPRTDCEYISSHLDLNSMLKSASVIPGLSAIISGITPSAIASASKNKKWVNDKAIAEEGHTALVPTMKAPSLGTLSPVEQEIYEMVCRRFTAIFLPPLLQDKVVAWTDIGGSSFRSNGKTLVDKGYTVVFGSSFTDHEIPVMAVGDPVNVDEFSITTKTSVCPKRYTSSEIIEVCENPLKFLDDPALKALGKRLKIGTPATRTPIIQTLIKTDQYLEVKKSGKREELRPTESGRSLIRQISWCSICKVDMTGQWEENLEEVRKGSKTLADLEAEMKQEVTRIVDEIKNNQGMTKLSGKGTGKYPRVAICKECGGEIISGPKNFYCENFKNGCKEGALKTCMGAAITDADFVKMYSGGTVLKKVTSKSTGNSWNQRLCYDHETHQITFFKNGTPPDEYKLRPGKCPCCGKEDTIMEGDHLLYCKECRFGIRKNIAEHEMTEEEIESILTTGKSPLIIDFISRDGKPFPAYLQVNEAEKKLDFLFIPRGVLFKEMKCPVCGGNLFKSDRTLACERGDFKLWLAPGWRPLSDDEMMELLTKKQVGPLDFTSKRGRPYKAILHLNEDGSVSFEYLND